jgi:cell division protein FtsA
LTGGSSALPGIRQLASQVLGLPVQVAQPKDLSGMVDHLQSPAYATSVGLLNWASMMSEFAQEPVARRSRVPKSIPQLDWDGVKNWLRRLLP